MKPIDAAVWLTAAFVFVKPSAGEVPTALGVLTDGPTTYVVLKAGPAQPATWLKIGDSFGPYLIRRFDPQKEVIELETADGTIELRLPESRIRLFVDLARVEALAKAGNSRLATLLDQYRKYEAPRNRLLAGAEDLKSRTPPSELPKLEEFIDWLRSENHPHRLKILQEMSVELATASPQHTQTEKPNKAPTPGAVTPRADLSKMK